MPNRNLQASQQIEQLQLRLQYLQRCSMTDFRATPQKLPEQNVQQQQHQQPQQQQQQPVSVMQRGSEVQVNSSYVLYYKFFICIKIVQVNIMRKKNC